MAHLKILPLVSFLLRPPCPLSLYLSGLRTEVDGEEENRQGVASWAFKAGRRRGGRVRLAYVGLGRRTSLRRSRGLVVWFGTSHGSVRWPDFA